MWSPKIKEDTRLEEGSQINRSLLILGTLIRKLRNKEFETLIKVNEWNGSAETVFSIFFTRLLNSFWGASEDFTGGCEWSDDETLSNSIAHCFSGRLLEGDIYAFTKFSLVPNKDVYCV